MTASSTAPSSAVRRYAFTRSSSANARRSRSSTAARRCEMPRARMAMGLGILRGASGWGPTAGGRARFGTDPYARVASPLACTPTDDGGSGMERGRARDLGVVIGTYPPGPRNAVTDVEGVRVGHRTIVRDLAPDGAGAVRTGLTTVFPHEGLPWIERVYAGTDILNGFGELIGINQIAEWGLLHSPIVMTSSLAIGRAYDATVRWRTARHATTIHEGGDMPFVCECDDSYLSDVTTFPLTDEDVFAALDAAVGGDVAEGCVGAGTGMQCMDFKGGIGTSSRTIPGGWTVGVLVLTNFGERELLRIDGVPVG